MLVWLMRWDQIQKFNKCLTNNGDGTFTLETTAGSASGTSNRSHRVSDTMRAFDRTIQNNAVRVV